MRIRESSMETIFLGHLLPTQPAASIKYEQISGKAHFPAARPAARWARGTGTSLCMQGMSGRVQPQSCRHEHCTHSHFWGQIQVWERIFTHKTHLRVPSIVPNIPINQHHEKQQGLFTCMDSKRRHRAISGCLQELQIKTKFKKI